MKCEVLSRVTSSDVSRYDSSLYLVAFIFGERQSDSESLAYQDGHIQGAPRTC